MGFPAIPGAPGVTRGGPAFRIHRSVQADGQFPDNPGAPISVGTTAIPVDAARSTGRTRWNLAPVGYGRPGPWNATAYLRVIRPGNPLPSA
jgi:hypothetical protein